MPRRYLLSSLLFNRYIPPFELTSWPHRHVIANDLSSSAVDAMKRNVELNGLSEPADVTEKPPDGKTPTYVKVNEGDAWYVESPQSRLGHHAQVYHHQVLLCITIEQNETVSM